MPVAEQITPEVVPVEAQSEDKGGWMPATKVAKGPVFREHSIIQRSSFALFQHNGEVSGSRVGEELSAIT